MLLTEERFRWIPPCCWPTAQDRAFFGPAPSANFRRDPVANCPQRQSMDRTAGRKLVSPVCAGTDRPKPRHHRSRSPMTRIRLSLPILFLPEREKHCLTSVHIPNETHHPTCRWPVNVWHSGLLPHTLSAQNLRRFGCRTCHSRRVSQRFFSPARPRGRCAAVPQPVFIWPSLTPDRPPNWRRPVR